jgi:hypothetical protein
LQFYYGISNANIYEIGDLDMSTFEVLTTVMAATAVVVSFLSWRDAQKSLQKASEFDQAARIRWAKLQCLRALMGNRQAVTTVGSSQETTDIFMTALNEIFITFEDAPNVLDAVRDISLSLNFGDGQQSQQFIVLFRAMMNDLGIALPETDDRHFERPFRKT